MNTNRFSSLLAFGLLAANVTWAQNTATTTPVGYVNLTVPASSDTNIGQPLHRPAELATTGTIAGDKINLTATLATNQFVYSPPTQRNAYYVLVKTSGIYNGRYFEILSNTANQIVVSQNLESLGLSGTISFEVVPFWTLSTLFPSGNGVGTTQDIFEPAGLVQFRTEEIGTNRAISRNFFHYTGTEEQGTGWYDNDNLSLGRLDDATIDPHTMIRIRNLENTTKTVVISGNVPTFTVQTPVTTASAPTDNYLSVQYPVDVTLAQSGLAGTAVRSSTDIFEPVDILFVYDDTATGLNKAPTRFFFHYVGTEEQGTGWYDNNDLSLGLQDNNPILKAGRGYVIRKSPGTPDVSSAQSSLPYTLNN